MGPELVPNRWFWELKWHLKWPQFGDPFWPVLARILHKSAGFSASAAKYWSQNGAILDRQNGRSGGPPVLRSSKIAPKMGTLFERSWAESYINRQAF